MATSETIKKKIENATKKLENLKKKLARIEEARNSGWKKNPYYYSEYDLKYTLRDISECEARLVSLKEMLKEIEDKENSRNILPILNFLALWKGRVFEYYKKAIDAYWDEREELDRFHKELEEKNGGYLSYGSPAYKEYTDRLDALRRKVSGYYEKQMQKFLGRERLCEVKVRDGEYEYAKDYLYGVTEFECLQRLQKDLEKEADAKYDDLVERVCKVCGKILNADGLSVGAKGELNGIIVGDACNVTVKTVPAEGPIQCFHYRTLVHEVRGSSK